MHPIRAGCQQPAVQFALSVGHVQQLVDLAIDAQRGLFQDLPRQVVGRRAGVPVGAAAESRDGETHEDEHDG